MNIFINMFLAGLTLGVGPCLSFCAPILLPYIAATSKGWKEALKITLIFSFSRFLAYVLLAFLAGWSAKLINPFLNTHPKRFNFLLIVGIFIILLGILILSGKKINFGFCQFLNKYFIDKSFPSMFIIGLSVGFAPCLPLIGILSYILVTASNPLQAALYGMSFGLGTIISPLILLGMAAGSLPKILFTNYKIYNLFIKICGVILILWGFYLIRSL